MRALACFVAAACLGAAWGQLSACGLDTDCNCPATPDRPEAQTLPINAASAYNAVGNDDVLPVDPRGGTIEITGDELIVRYEQDGTPREVVYDASSPQ
jgi:hypothetical protein